MNKETLKSILSDPTKSCKEKSEAISLYWSQFPEPSKEEILMENAFNDYLEKRRAGIINERPTAKEDEEARHYASVMKTRGPGHSNY